MPFRQSQKSITETKIEDKINLSSTFQELVENDKKKTNRKCARLKLIT